MQREAETAAGRVTTSPAAVLAANPPKLASKPSDGWKELVAGTISGFGKVIAGYPFDAVKSRVQAGKFPTAWQALLGTVGNEGFLALYQGVVAPTINVCFVGGILFYCNGYIRTAIQPDKDKRLTSWQMFQAGGGAGFVVGVVVNPIEVLKLKMQVLNKKAVKNPEEARFRAVLANTSHANLWAGFTPTVIREVGTFGLFFPINEYLKAEVMRLAYGVNLYEYKPSEQPRVPIWARVTAAGFAGVFCWLPLFPVDQVKSKMQLEGAFSYRSSFHCAGAIYRAEGLRHGFFKGLAPCLIRAFPAYAAQFLLYEQVAAGLQAM